MLLIIAPLLYHDGLKADLSQFRDGFGTLFSMAVFLAVITAVIMGLGFHTLMPVIPIALCITLTAIVTPTDSLALQSITQNIDMPESISSVLETESLFNDASGIVIFNLAISAYTSGQFSIAKGLTSFGISFFGGIFLGLIAGLLFFSLYEFLISKSMDTSSVLVPLTLMAPIAIYLVAEEFHFSGILAAVTAGIVHGLNSSRLKLTSTDVQLVTSSSWDLIAKLLSGVVFVLLGVTLPTVASQVVSYSTGYIFKLTIFAAILYLGICAVRYLWVKLNLVKVHPQEKATNKEALITSIGGIHGTITLSMALSLPLTLAGESFPFRSQLIFIATIVILLSLITPTLWLPRLVGRKQAHNAEAFYQFRNSMADYSISQIKQEETIPIIDRNYVIDMLNSQKKRGHINRDEVQEITNQTNKLIQDKLYSMLTDNQIPDRFAKAIARRGVSRSHQRGNFWSRLGFWIKVQFVRKKTKKFEQQIARKPGFDQTKMNNNKQAFFEIQRKTNKQILVVVNDYLDQIETPDNADSVNYVRQGYTMRLSRGNIDESSAQRRTQLLIKAFQYEYSFVANLFNANKIEKALSDRLNQSITTDQMVYLQSVDEG